MSQKRTTICLLMYGDYPELHRAAISGLMKSDLRNANVRIWCNIVCEETLKMLLSARPAGWWIYVNTENRPKYKLMRDIFHDTRYPIDTPWVTWLDDDTMLIKSDWATHTLEHLQGNKSIDFCGMDTNGRYYPGAYNVVKQAKWYTGVKFGRGISRHVYGAYWWMKTDVMRALNWPDTRLSHNGGDWLLSEALRQQRYKQQDFSYGIKVQLRALRRGLSEVSVGRRNNKHTSRSDGKRIPTANTMALYRNVLDHAGVSYVPFDEHTLLVQIPELIDVSKGPEEYIRLSKLAAASYPTALPKNLFLDAKKKSDGRKDRESIRAAKRDARRASASVRKRRRAEREKKMADKIQQSRRARNAPVTTSPLPRVTKSQQPERVLPPPPKARKTLKQLLEERRKK